MTARIPSPIEETAVLGAARKPQVEIFIPVYNEERALPGSIRTLHRHLRDELPLAWRITVVDNASTDATLATAEALAAELPHVGVLHLDRKGRGLALRTAWAASEADVVAYMDVALSTGLAGLLPLLAPLVTGHSDLAVGSRLAPGARTVRGPRREFISRVYNALIRMTHGARFSDRSAGSRRRARRSCARCCARSRTKPGWLWSRGCCWPSLRSGDVSAVPLWWRRSRRCC